MTLKKIKLGQIAKVKGGKRLPKGEALTTTPNRHPYIRVRDMGEKYLPINGLEYVPESVFPLIKNYIVSKGDVILSIVGSVGLVSIVNEGLDKASLTENCVKILPENERLDQQFLYYFLRSSLGQDQIKQKTVGAVQPKLPIYNINEIEINLPPLPTQKAIAEILSSLDDKIELNNQINQNLEALAQALFKQWFVDFEFPNENGEPYKSSGGEMVDSELGEIPKGWKVDSIKNLYLVSDFVANGSFASLKENVQVFDSPNYAIFLRNTDSKSNFSGDLRYVDKKSYDFLEKSRIQGDEICISNVADVGTVFRPPTFLNKPMTLGNNLVFIRTGSPNYHYLYFKYFNGQSQIQSITSGSAQLKFNKTDFRSLPVFIVPEPLLSKFEDLIGGIWARQEINLVENGNLTKLRDTLLPKLISGELEVNESLLEQTF